MFYTINIKSLNCKWIGIRGSCGNEIEANLIFDIISESDFKFMIGLGYILLDKFDNEIRNFYDLLSK